MNGERTAVEGEEEEEKGGLGVSPSFGMGTTPGAPVFSQQGPGGGRRLTPHKGQLKRLSLGGKAAFANSTNSLFITETPSAPDERELTRCAAKAILLLLAKKPRAALGSRFDELAFPLTSNHDLDTLPDEQSIYSFLRLIYKRTRMQPECIVMMVSYIEKLMAMKPSLGVACNTWRRIVVAALVVADKVFEDYAVWNADFLALFPKSNIDDLNTLEREFLNAIVFETTFKASDYAKFYFALRELSENMEALPAKPLTKQQQEDLEHKSASFSKEKSKDSLTLARSASLSDFQPRRTKSNSSLSSE